MTRTSHSSAPIVRMSRKAGSGGTYPQWMRTLEEKYQKLHKKIAENTSLGNTKFSHATGRSVYDVRLSHALAKSREIVASRSFVHLKKRGPEIDGAMLTSPSDPALCRETDEHHNDEDKYLYNEDFNHVCKETSDCCKLDENGSHDHILIDATSVVSRDGEALDACGDDLIIRGEMRSSEYPENDDGDCTARDSSYHDDLNRRNVKTSLSRTSKFTSKSCPAQIQSQSAKVNDRVQRIPLARSKSTHNNAKMGTIMSDEAKHAITETIQEMRISTPHKSKTCMTEFVPSRNRKCVKSWAVPRRTNAMQRPNHDPRSVLENASARLQNVDNTTPQDNKADGSDRSTNISERGNNSILPDIQHDSKEKIPLPLFSYRLLGIGKYDIANKDSFEITPPGFDSRYNDVLPVEDRESETPPPDIRQQAIEKCSEWLVKHNAK